jgi:outer membrane protein
MKRTNTFFMKTGLLTTLMVTLAIGLLRAQTDSSYTLQQCIDYALKNSTTVQNSEFDEYIAKAQIGEVRGAGLPQINATGTVIDNPLLARMFLRSPGPFFPAGTPPGTYALPNFFQLRSNGDAKLSATQLIFSGSYLVGLQAAKTYSELATKNTTLSKSQVVENVTKAFYLVLINEERKKLLDANLTSLDSLQKQMRAMNQQGFIEKIDVSRIEVTYNNLIVEKSKFDLMADLSKYLLKYQMGFDVNTRLNLNGKISDITEAGITIPTSDTSAYINRPEYDLLKTQRRLEELNLKNKRAYYLPTLAAFGNFGYSRGASSLGGLFEKRAPAFYYNGANISSTWFNYYNYGLSLNVPVFSGLSQRYRVQQSKINLKKIDNNVQIFKEGSAFQAKQAEVSMRNNLLATQSQKRNMELATEIRKVSKIKYEQGVGSNLEIVNAETSYTEASTNYYNALYDLVIAQVDYQKSVGTLYKK